MKKPMLKSINVLLALLFFSTALWAQSVHLEEALQTALRNNAQLKQAREKIRQKNYASRAAWGNFLPSVTLQGGYTHLNDPLQIDLNPIRQAMIQLHTRDQVGLANLQSLIVNHRPLSASELILAQQATYDALNKALPPFKETFKAQDYQTATLIGVQPLFLGGKLIAAKNYANDEQKAAQAEWLKTKNEVMRDVIRNYLTVAFLHQVVQTRQQVLQGMRQHQQQAQSLFKQGLIAKTDVLRAQVAVAEAERHLFDDRNKLQLAYLALKHSMGLPSDAPLFVADTLCYHPFTDSLETIRQKAQHFQPLLKLVAVKKDEARQKLLADASEFLPQVALFGKYEMYPQYLSSLEPRWAVGVNLQINLFKGFKKYNRFQASRHLHKQLEYLQDDVAQQIDLWVNKSYREMRNARERYFKLQANITLARENLKSQEKRFQTGLGTSLDVIDARLLLQKDRIERLKSLYDYYLSLTDLYVAQGDAGQVTSIICARTR